MNAHTPFLRFRLVCVAALVLEAVAILPLNGQSLDSLVRRAVEFNPSIAAGRLSVEQEWVRARAEGAWEEPRIGLEFGELPTAEPLPWSQGETMLMGEQTIPLFGQNRAMREAMELGARVVTEDLLDRQWDLRGRVEREYYEIWLVDRRIEVANESKETAEYLYRSIEGRFALGRATHADLLLARGEVERLESEQRELAVQRKALLGRLNRLVGFPIDRSITPVISDSDLEYSTLLPMEIAPDINPQLRRMTAMSEMSEAQAVAAERMLKPMLMLRGGVSFMPKGHPVREGDVGMSEETGTAGEGEPEVMRFGVTVGAMISIPIAPWSRSGPNDRAEAYRLQAESQRYERNAMELEMEMMLASAVTDLDRATLRETYYRETGIPLLERTLEALDLEYGEGRTTFNRLLDANSMLTMTRMEAYMARMERAMALSMIRRLVGTDILKGK